MLGIASAHARLGPASNDTIARAKAAVAEGRGAASRGDFEGALQHFQEALELRPAPPLHFNIAVCHHNLMLAATPESEAYESHRRAAIEAYGAYLAASPEADDRARVEATIDELGGRPKTADAPWVIERIDPDDVPIAPALRDASEPPPDARPPKTREPDAPRPEVPTDVLPFTGRIGPFVPLTLASMVELTGSDEAAAAAGIPAIGMRALPGIGLGLRGGAFLGARRRIAVGGELWATGQPISSRRRPVLVSGTLAPTVEYAHPVLRGRMEIGAGGALGVMLQTLRYVGDTPPACSVSQRGALSTRPGVLLSGRLLLSVLLGARRNHELSLRVSPALAAFGPGSRAGDDADTQPTVCSELPTPFETLGLSGRAALVVMIDLGYAPRF